MVSGFLLGILLQGQMRDLNMSLQSTLTHKDFLTHLAQKGFPRFCKGTGFLVKHQFSDLLEFFLTFETSPIRSSVIICNREISLFQIFPAVNPNSLGHFLNADFSTIVTFFGHVVPIFFGFAIFASIRSLGSIQVFNTSYPIKAFDIFLYQKAPCSMFSMKNPPPNSLFYNK